MSSNSYPLPNRNPSNYGTEQIPALKWDGSPVNSIAKISLYNGTVTDNYQSDKTAVHVRLSGTGSWDSFLNQLNTGQFTLYRENYVDAANLLIPRAIGYSAGLLNHFFRGRLKITLPSEQVYAVADFATQRAFSTFKMMVQNVSTVTSPNGDVLKEATDPTRKLIAVLRFRTNTCFKWPTLAGSPYWNPDGSNQYVWDEACRTPSMNDQYLPDIKVSLPADIPAGGIDGDPQPVVFTFPDPLPFDAVDVDLQVVYRGKLGAESDDVAVGFEAISEPTFFDFVNFADCPGAFPDHTCALDDPNSQCWYSGAVHLPAPDAAPIGTQRTVASIKDLKPGHFGRAAFLTTTGTTTSNSNLEVVTNQQYDFMQTITYPDGTHKDFGPGREIWGQLLQGRLVRDETSGAIAPMYEWFAKGIAGAGCVGTACGVAAWAATACTVPISNQPVPVEIQFPDPRSSAAPRCFDTARPMAPRRRAISTSTGWCSGWAGGMSWASATCVRGCARCASIG